MKNVKNANIKRWTLVCRALANGNRLGIVGMLQKGKKMNVTEIANALDISHKATSNHLALLKNLDVLDAHGAAGHVWYSLNPDLPQDFKTILPFILRES